MRGSRIGLVIIYTLKLLSIVALSIALSILALKLYTKATIYSTTKDLLKLMRIGLVTVLVHNPSSFLVAKPTDASHPLWILSRNWLSAPPPASSPWGGPDGLWASLF